MTNKGIVSHQFQLNPMCWLRCFEFPISEERARQLIINRVRELESEYRATRPGGVVGAKRLMQEGMDTTYVSKTHAKRMLCISWNKELRMRFIQFVKDLRAAAREVLQKWRQGMTGIPFPAGLFPPSFPRLSNILPQAEY